MLYERIMAMRRSTGGLVTTMRTLHRYSQGQTFYPLLSSLLLKQKARARPGDARLAARPPLLFIRFSVSSASSRLLLRARLREHMFMNNAILQQERTLEKPTNLDDRNPTAHRRQIHPRFAPFISQLYFQSLYNLLLNLQINLGRNRQIDRYVDIAIFFLEC